MTPFLSGEIRQHERTVGEEVEIGEIGLRRLGRTAAARTAGRRRRLRSPRKSSPTFGRLLPVSVLRIAQGFSSRLGRSSMLPGILLRELAIDDVAVFVADVAAGDVLRFGPRRGEAVRLGRGIVASLP